MSDPDVPALLTARVARLEGTERDLVRALHRGEVVRLRSGFYLPVSAWTAMDADARYRTRVVAASAALHPARQFSHDSAAVMWRLPSVGAWSPRIHTLGESASGGRSSRGITRHSIGLDDRARPIDGVLTTSLARTVLDEAMTTSFARAVCMIDAALRPPEVGEFRYGLASLSPFELTGMWKARSGHRSSSRAGKAISFSTEASGSIGESVSRVNFHLLGMPAPLLQVPFRDEEGMIGYVDFFWPHLGLIGEFDGRVKYRNRYYLRGRLPEEVVWAEKQREDRLRRVSSAFVRWDWATARDRFRLQQRVAPFGLVPSR